MGAGMINQMHVIHPRRAGGHAPQAGQAAIKMLDRLGVRWRIGLQHILYQNNPAARAVAFIAQQLIRRTSGGAKSAMDAFAQDRIAFRDIGIQKLGRRKLCAHDRRLFPHPPRVQNTLGIEL